MTHCSSTGRRPRRATPLLACVLPLVAGLLAPGTTALAARVSPLTMAPAEFLLAVTAPADVRLRRGDVLMHFAFTPRGPTAQPLDEVFVLEVAPAPRERAPRIAGDEQAWSATLAAGDYERLRAAQAAVTSMRAQGVKGAGSLRLEVVGACHRSAQAPETLPVRTYLGQAGGERFTALGPRRDLLRATGSASAASLRGRIGPC